MQQINDPQTAVAILHDPAFVVPPVPPAAAGVGWLRATVGRFSTGPAHERRRALSTTILDGIPLATLRAAGDHHPVTVLARAIGVHQPVECLVRDIAQAYQPGTGDEPRADAAVDRLVTVLGGAYDEPTAARIGVLVQACDATAALIAGARHRPVEEVLRDDPPVRATRRQALAATTVGGVAGVAGVAGGVDGGVDGGVSVEAGEIVLIGLAGGPAFGAGPRRCPGRAHALALVEGSRAARR